MKEPTEAQIKEFWERCGLEVVEVRNNSTLINDKEGGDIIDLDLNNLFKYAVPKLEGGLDIRFSKYDDKGWFVKLENQVMTTEAETPALALFWACYKAFGLGGDTK